MTVISYISTIPGSHAGQVFKLLEKEAPLPSALCGLITDFLFTDIQKIYQKAIASLSHVPKNLAESLLLAMTEQWEYARDALSSEKNRPTFIYLDAMGCCTMRTHKLIKEKNIHLLSSEILGRALPFQKRNIELDFFDFNIQQEKHTASFAVIFVPHSVQKDFERTLLSAITHCNPEKLSEEGIWKALLLFDNKNIQIFALELLNWIWVVNFGNSKAFLKMGDKLIALTAPSSQGKITPIPRKCLQKGDYVLLGSSENFNKTSLMQIYDAMETHREIPPYNLVNNIAFSCAQAGDSEDFCAVALFRILE